MRFRKQPYSVWGEAGTRLPPLPPMEYLWDAVSHTKNCAQHRGFMVTCRRAVSLNGLRPGATYESEGLALFGTRPCFPFRGNPVCGRQDSVQLLKEVSLPEPPWVASILFVRFKGTERKKIKKKSHVEIIYFNYGKRTTCDLFLWTKGVNWVMYFLLALLGNFAI